MRTERLCLVLMIISLVNIARSQEVFVEDAETGTPLPYVTIYNEDKTTTAVTDSAGSADITAFRNSKAIYFQILGYNTRKFNYYQLEQANFRVRLEPAALRTDEVVISATRWEQPLSDLPQKISLIKRKDFFLENPQTAADLLGISGEVFIQKSQYGGGSPMIRGFATNRVLLVVDGVRMNTAIFRSGNVQNVISLDPFAIEKTEVTFGPGSLIYGSDAIGGVMSFITLKPRFSENGQPLVSGNATSRFSSAALEKSFHADFNTGWKKWAFTGSFSYFNYGDLKMGRHGPDDYLRKEYIVRIDTMDVVVSNPDPRVQKPTGYDQYNLMAKLRFSPRPEYDFTYALHYSETSDYARYDRLLRYRNGLPRSAEWYYGPQVWMMHHASLLFSNSNKFYDHFGMQLAYQQFEESRHDRDFNDIHKRHRTENVDAWSMNLDFEKRIGERHWLFYGAENIFNRVTSKGEDENILTGELMPAPSRYPDGSKWISQGVYASYRFKPGPKVSFQMGLRFNQDILNATFDTTFYPFPFTSADLHHAGVTGNTGVVWKPAEKWNYHIHFSTGYRAPNIDDIGKVFDSEPGAVVVPNPDLKPEYAWNGEAGITRIFGKYVKINLTGYYTLLDNAIVRRDYTLNGKDTIIYDGVPSRVQAMQNAARAWVYGLQAAMEMKVPGGFGFNTHFNYQKGEEELDNGTTAPLRHAAPLFGDFAITYRYDRITGEIKIVYNGKISYDNLPPSEREKDYIYAKDDEGNPYAPGWYTLNLKMRYAVTEQIFVSAGIENITDQRYKPYSSGIAAPGRNFLFSAGVNF